MHADKSTPLRVDDVKSTSSLHRISHDIIMTLLYLHFKICGPCLVRTPWLQSVS